MEYIATHPWIQPLDAAGLQAFPTRQGIDQAVSLCPGHLCPAVRPPTLAAQPGFSPGESTDPLTGETFLLEQLTTLPESRLAETAWLAFTNLTRAAPDPVLKGLRENYLGQLYGLILGAKWAENPSSQSRCDVDADLDGMPECILASETVFTIIDPAGARITFAFAASQDSDRNGGKPVVHQMIGPASQFSVGISDPATWDLAGGPSADPNEIPGAFTDSPDPFRLYHPTVGAGLIRFTSLDGTTVKEMRLLPGSLAVQYVTSTPLTSRIPLAVDPGAWFQPGGPWLFLSGRSSLGWSWGLPQHPRVEMRSTAPLHWMTSRDSAALLSDPEDPNLDYPPGHFLPFPLALVEMEVSREASLELHFW
jgi:hypothetical protein